MKQQQSATLSHNNRNSYGRLNIRVSKTCHFCFFNYFVKH